MKIEEIEKLNKGEVIPSLEGLVIQTYSKPPTDGQKRANIEPMDVVVEDDDGKQIKVSILRKSMHLPPGSQGRRVLFECGEGERGPDGLKADPYNNTMRVSCSGSASIRFRDEEAPAPKPLPEQATDEHHKMMNGARIQQSLGPRRTTNVTDHCLTMVEIYNSIMSKLQRDDCDMAETVAKLATTVYIETARQALIVPRLEGDPAPEPMVEQIHSPEPEPELPVAAFPKKEESESVPNQKTVADMVRYHFREKPVTGEFAEKFLKKVNKKWEDVYDEMVETIVLSGVEKKYVDQTYDEFNGTRLSRGEPEGDFLKRLFVGMKDFADTARDIQNSNSTTVENDDFV